jgi:hypothetical protein
MANGPRPGIEQNPRFGEVLEEALRKQGLTPVMGEPVRKLVTGTADPRSFACCNSGCIPCVKDYLRAAEMVLKELPEDPKKRRRLWPF